MTWTVGRGPRGGLAVPGGGGIITPPAPGPLTLLPTQPFSHSWGDDGPTSLTAQHARPGGLVTAGRTNYGHQIFKDISAAGGSPLLYIDTVINNKYGRYHGLIMNASAYGPAVPDWSGKPANQWGNLLDFRPGSVLHTKLEPVLELSLSENPHLAGFIADDVGSMSWFAGSPWSSFSSTDKQDYRDGMILIAQAFNRVCLRHGLILIVNGTWHGGGLTSSGGGYPNMAATGLSLADGGYIEHHAINEGGGTFWVDYATAAQWGIQAVTAGARVMLANGNNAAERDAWIAANVVAFVGSQYSGDYIEVGTSGLAGHATALPSKVAA